MKFWDALKRRSREADNQAAKAIDVADSEANRQALEDAKKEINRYEQNIVKLIGSRKVKEKRLPALQAEISKFDAFARKAGSANDQEGLRQAVTKLQTFQTDLKTLQGEIQKDAAEESKYKKQLDSARDLIARSEQKTQLLKVKEDSANIRKSMAQFSMGSGNSALSRLGEWEKKVDQNEAEAEALEEIAAVPTAVEESLESKYGSGNADIDNLMAQYMPATTGDVRISQPIAGELPAGGGSDIDINVTIVPKQTIPAGS